jgi:hypothetical protein
MGVLKRQDIIFLFSFQIDSVFFLSGVHFKTGGGGEPEESNARDTGEKPKTKRAEGV